MSIKQSGVVSVLHHTFHCIIRSNCAFSRGGFRGDKNCVYESRLVTQSSSVLHGAEAEAAVRVPVFDVRSEAKLFGCLVGSWDRRGQSVME